MQNNLQQIVFMAKHGPAVIVGLLFIGSALVMFMHIQLTMIRARYKTSWGQPLAENGWDTPFAYLKIRTKHGWSPWPAFFYGLACSRGIVIFVYGVFRLSTEAKATSPQRGQTKVRAAGARNVLQRWRKLRGAASSIAASSFCPLSNGSVTRKRSARRACEYFS